MMKARVDFLLADFLDKVDSLGWKSQGQVPRVRPRYDGDESAHYLLEAPAPSRPHHPEG
jgi:hypothetical protein